MLWSWHLKPKSALPWDPRGGSEGVPWPFSLSEGTQLRATWNPLLQGLLGSSVLIKDAHLVSRRYLVYLPSADQWLQLHTNLIHFSLRFDVDCQPQPDSPALSLQVLNEKRGAEISCDLLSLCLFNLYEMPGCMKHNLESRLLWEISITSDM